MRWRIKISIAICFVCAIFVGALSVNNVMADEGGWIGSGSSSGGGGWSGAGSDCSLADYRYRVDCAGVSWIYYKAVTSTDKEVEFAPFPCNGSNCTGSNRVKISPICSNGGQGGFWHLGVNVQATLTNLFSNNTNFNQDKYRTTQGKWGHWTTATGAWVGNNLYRIPGKAGSDSGFSNGFGWNVGQLDHKLGEVVNGQFVTYYQADSVTINTSEVLADYQKAYKQQYPNSSAPTSLPTNLYAFCYWNGIGDELYGASSVALSPRPAGESKNWKSTGVTNSTTRVDYGPLTTSVGKTVDITFSHNVYAKAETNNVKWQVVRSWVGSNNSGYEFGTQSSGSLAASSNGQVNLTKPKDGYYVPATTDYSDGAGNYYIMRDTYTNVKFTAAGTYEFCETLTVEGSSVNTTACTSVIVNNIDYYAVSNMAVGSSGRKTTHLVGSPAAVQIDMVYAKVNNDLSLVPVTFSHAVYASDSVKASWTVKRIFNTCSSSNSNDKCVISARENISDPLDNGDSGFAESVARTTSLTKANAAAFGDKGVYGSEEDKRIYGDGYNGEDPYTHRYDWRDKYNVKFKKVGDYSNSLCEKISIPGNDSDLTTACALISVPYNFRNTAEVELASNTVGSDGMIGIKEAKVNVGTKQNDAVYVKSNDSKTYATQVDGATVKLISYTSGDLGGDAIEGFGNLNSELCDAISHGGSCGVLDTKSGLSFNSGNNTNGVTEDVSGIKNKNYNISSPNVGGYYCVRLAVYPFTSGSDTNVNDAEGSHSWYISAPSCALVAKKPTFQIWGGSIYSDGMISAHAFERNIDGNNRTFSSWAEQSVVANGNISGIASGAATSQGALPDFCKYQVALTFANYPCFGSGPVGNANVAVDTSGKDAAIGYWWVSNPVVGASDFVEGINTSGDRLYYKYNIGDIEMGEMSNLSGGTYVVRSESGNIHISGNINYANGPYTSVSEIPKLIVYAKNIYIDCGVSRVDAILVADNKIDTCADASGANPGDINDISRSRQLRINGILMAKQVMFNRTYGGGASEEAAKTPAEIVNYDTSTVLWGRGGTEGGTDSLFTVVYQQELAPRY